MTASAKSRPPKTMQVKLDVPFYDLDGLNVVWHGHYYKYFERARTALLRSVGFDASEMIHSGYRWFVIESHCRYIAPIRYGMTLNVRVTLADSEHRLKFVYLIQDKKTDRRLAAGHTIHAAVHAKTGKLSLVTPPVFLRHLK